MKARALKKILNDTGYIVHETDEKICIGSPLCHDLISFGKADMQLRYALDTYRKGKQSLRHDELLFIWEKLEQLIASGEIHELITGQDVIDKPLPVFTHGDDYQIIESVTDEYGWPNTDITGRLMYDNTWFKTRRAAIKRAISDCSSSIKWREESAQEKRAQITELEGKIQASKIALARLKEELRS